MATDPARYRVFTIVERQDDAPFWLNIGMAYPHKDGKGFNVRLQALPLKGRLALRTFADPNEPEQPASLSGFDEEEPRS